VSEQPERQQPILVLGGTGKTGRRVVEQLRARGWAVRVGSRRGEPPFDWNDRATWEAAVQGAAAAYVIDPSLVAGSEPEEGARALRDFLALAVGAGTRRFVFLSARDLVNVGDPSLFEGERAIRESGAEWTILRPAWFAQNFSEEPFLAGQVAGGVVTLSTGDGLEPFIDAEDIAEVAAVALTEDGHAGETYELSGPRLLTFREAVETIRTLGGHDVRFVDGTSEQSVASLEAHGLEHEFAVFTDRLFGWIAEGRNARLSDGVQRVLGREPRDFADNVRRTPAAAWRGSPRR
jgi:uncharacterized protein YbjT (DUF2867 family)